MVCPPYTGFLWRPLRLCGELPLLFRPICASAVNCRCRSASAVPRPFLCLGVLETLTKPCECVGMDVRSEAFLTGGNANGKAAGR